MWCTFPECPGIKYAKTKILTEFDLACCGNVVLTPDLFCLSFFLSFPITNANSYFFGIESVELPSTEIIATFIKMK